MTDEQMKHKIKLAYLTYIKGLLALFSLLFIVLLPVQAICGDPVHLNITKNPVGCAACHKGHGKKGTSMLSSSKAEICFSCHSPAGLRRNIRTDLQTVFRKRYKHPVDSTYIYHYRTEELPEKNSSSPRHVACDDCHRVHEVETDNVWRQVPGYTKNRQKDSEAAAEYELCYKCHSDSANRPYNSLNKREQFDLDNLSYHPIEGRGRNTKVPSLIRPLDVSSTIRCSDCHGNDDKFGAVGPHGSNYEHILKARYLETEGSESQKAYELCYFCHDRRSILANESFQKHKEHVVYYHAPCSACHDPHGTSLNQHLIRFSSSFMATGSLSTYVSSYTGRPQCLLTCHIGGKDVKHDNAFYSDKKWP